ncbi:MAG: ankyrin repeat domain-containing protein [Planctomycetes bacterium]|nr:ankyrin repeat domain-containing protein [Planctomycetota bacterium]
MAGEPSLFEAVDQGDAEAVRRALERDPAVVHGDASYRGEPSFRSAPLTHAAYRGHLEVVRVLLEANAPLRPRNAWNPLEQAAAGGHLELVLALLQAGAKPDAGDALAEAAKGGHLEIMRALLDAGADPNRGQTYSTPLDEAARSGSMAAVRLVLERGARCQGSTALLGAAQKGSSALIELLLERGADLGARYANGQTALHVAAYEGNASACEALLQAGADPDATDDSGDTAVDVATGDDLVSRLRPTGGADAGDVAGGLLESLRQDLEKLRQFLTTLKEARVRRAIIRAAERRVVRWEWLSNSFADPRPYYSERFGFPRPRLLRDQPSSRGLARGATQLGVDRDGRRVLEREVMHALDGVVKCTVYRRLAPDLVVAVVVDSHEVKRAWVARVEDRGLRALIHSTGQAEVYRWEGPRLITVDHWERLDRRTRSGGREEFSHDAHGRLDSIEVVAADGARRTRFKRKERGESISSVVATSVSISCARSQAW